MLEFDESFFEAEVRDDFLIDETMKTIWAAEMEVLQEIAIICDRHNLKWVAAYGTLLGAVRHNGYIPWDDDLDIMMMREDYMELLKYLPEELPNGYDVRCSQLCVEDEKDEYQCTVFNARTVSIMPERLARFHGCPFIVGVDIFPVDYINRDYEKATYQRDKFSLIRQTISIIRYEEDNDENRNNVEEALKTINNHCGTDFVREYTEESDRFLTNKLWKLANEIAMETTRRDGEKISQYINYINNKKIVFDKHILDEIIYLPFEQVMLPVPKEYDKILSTIYGNYMVKIRGGSAHEYPVYNKQLNLLREVYQRWEEANAKDEAAIKAAREANNS